MLVIDWDESNASDILVPCMFDDIYRLYTGENLKPDGGWIDADKYESVMLSMFPVTVTELRDKCDYNPEKDSYRYHVILGNSTHHSERLWTIPTTMMELFRLLLMRCGLTRDRTLHLEIHLQ